ncbi:uncharacterized protein NECHADRAFT_84070 [Fusarium vanettenii 77-13-4]|uniref:Uncharacterized protein n=1 Tax=Fusarium vanettenii (strain ATCC MYA-4622 / CBS 123669 / FGSC 9596 / NRRL 45880 / 77-13-4) TaxID=660122 RepID=C7YZL5_FUSV7|nr:uncharacterized protein NECHADRAFT_84070 [Fusarium vanettenii 77-13-4]EEU42822.1 predicted protein [Fusarium vanettenii 77-13-4]
MAADEAPSDPDPTGDKTPPAIEEEEEEEEEKANPNKDHKGSMLPRFIYDTSSVTERLMRRADADANKDSARDGKTSKGIDPNNTKAKDSDREESNQKSNMFLAPPFTFAYWTASVDPFPQSAPRPGWAPFKSSILEFTPTMSSQVVSSNTTSGSPCKNNYKDRSSNNNDNYTSTKRKVFEQIAFRAFEGSRGSTAELQVINTQLMEDAQPSLDAQYHPFHHVQSQVDGFYCLNNRISCSSSKGEKNAEARPQHSSYL